MYEKFLLSLLIGNMVSFTTEENKDVVCVTVTPVAEQTSSKTTQKKEYKTFEDGEEDQTPTRMTSKQVIFCYCLIGFNVPSTY